VAVEAVSTRQSARVEYEVRGDWPVQVDYQALVE